MLFMLENNLLKRLKINAMFIALSLTNSCAWTLSFLSKDEDTLNHAGIHTSSLQPHVS